MPKFEKRLKKMKNPLSAGVYLVQKQVNDGTRDRNIKPNRIDEPREFFVRLIPPFEPATQSDYDNRTDNGRQDRVWCEDREIDRPDNALTRKFCRPQPKVICAQGMMRDVHD